MKKIFQWIAGVCQLSDAWPVLLPFLGPLVWVYWLAVEKHYFQLLIVSLLWLVSAIYIIHAIHKGKNLTFSLGVFLTWMVVLTFVFVKHYA